MFQMMGVFAEFERAIIVDRVKAGLARAKAEQQAGKERVGRDGKMKRAIGRPRIKPEVIAAVWRLREVDQLSIEKIAAAQEIGVGSVRWGGLTTPTKKSGTGMWKTPQRT